MSEVKLGRYCHYKGKDYQVLGTAKHSETLEEFVFYKALYGDFGYWVRPKKMFLENIEINGEIIPRFKLMEHENKKL